MSFIARTVAFFSYRSRWFLCAVLIVLQVLANTLIGQSRSVVHESVSDWLSGRLDGVAVSQDGELLPGMQVREKIDLGVDGVEVVWSAVDDGQGGVLLGTGPEGKLLHVTKSGEVKVFADLEQSHVFAVCRTSDDEIWAAASPGGVLYKIAGGKEPVRWWAGGVEYLWAVLPAESGVLLATGRPARLIHVYGQDQSRLICDVPDIHARTMLKTKGGAIFIGTVGRGLFLRWDGQRLRALAATDRAEIRGLHATDEGNILFFTAGDISENGSDAAGKRNMASGRAGTSNSRGGSSSSGDKDFDVFASLGGKGTDNGSRGNVEIKGDLWLWSERDGAKKIVTLPGQPHAMTVTGSEILIGSGSRGYVFRVDLEKRKISAVVQAEANYVTAFLSTRDGVRMFGSYAACLMKLRQAENGAFESCVVDAGGEATWGRIDVLGKALKVQRRFGWTPEPDPLWTDWSDVTTQQLTEKPLSRFLQYRLVPDSGGIRRAEIFYTMVNRAPQFREMVVLASGEKYELVQSPASGSGQQSLEQLLRNEQQSRKAISAGGTPSRLGNAAGGENPLSSIRVVSGGGSSFRTLVFVVEDPNLDEIEFTVESKMVGESHFRMLKSGIDKPYFNFDTRGWLDGWYQFRVIAKDKPALGLESLSSEKISEPVLVDNTPPIVEFTKKTSSEISFCVRDNHSVLASVMVSYDGLHFHPILPDDAVLDSREETFSLPLRGDCIKEVFVRVEDRVGNLAGGHCLLE